jgi:L-arabinose isomerase
LKDGGFMAFTDTFQDLHGLKQLPGLAVQRLMRDGYGFGAEGDWKTSALVRAMKVMNAGLPGGVSFMEDYTYHFSASGDKDLGAHMLEICESIAAHKPKLEIHPLGIGGKEDPVRLVFDSQLGAAVGASIVHMGNRFRMVASVVDVVPNDAPLPNLPVARALVDSAPQPLGRCGSVDLRRRRTSHQLQLLAHHRTPARLCRHGWHRVPRHRREHPRTGIPRETALE